MCSSLPSHVTEHWNECRGRDEYGRRCTTASKWILLSLLHNWTGTCNVSQSFNSNLPWPVVAYIIINHPCQLVQTNCWVEAVNRWMAFRSLYITTHSTSKHKPELSVSLFYLHMERLWWDSAHRHCTVIWAKTSVEVDQRDGHFRGS